MVRKREIDFPTADFRLGTSEVPEHEKSSCDRVRPTFRTK